MSSSRATERTAEGRPEKRPCLEASGTPPSSCIVGSMQSAGACAAVAAGMKLDDVFLTTRNGSQEDGPVQVCMLVHLKFG